MDRQVIHIRLCVDAVFYPQTIFFQKINTDILNVSYKLATIFMQPPFPTKKFFIVLLFLVLVAGGTSALFGFLRSRPVQKAPDEKQVAIIQREIARNTQYDLTDPITEKDIATSTLNAVAAVVYLNQQTKANGATIGEIAASVGKEIQKAKDKLDGDTYTMSNLSAGNDNSPEALKKYGNDMAEIFITTSNKYNPKESYLVLVKQALESGDPKKLKKLDPYVDFYKNIIKDSLALKVPSSAASIHLNIINSYAETLALIQAFQAVFDDAPSAVAAHSRLEKASARFMDAFKGAADFFKEKGVVFFQGEKGALFSLITQDYIKQ